MMELIIGALIVLALLICLGALFQPPAETENVRALYRKDELIELFSSLPPDARIHITIENIPRDDNYGDNNHRG